MIQRTIAREFASRMLAQHGVATIWDFHIAAAVAHEFGNKAVAASLIEMAEAAEEEWMQWHASVGC